MKNLTFLLLFLISSTTYAGCAGEEPDASCLYGMAIESAREYIANGEYKNAETFAEMALNMDSSDSWARLYLITALVGQSKEIPDWLRNDPWTQATQEDKIIEKIGIAILKNN